MMNQPLYKWVKWLRLPGLSFIALCFLNFSPVAGLSPMATSTHPNSNTPHALHSPFSLYDSIRLDELYDNLALDSLGLTPEAYHKAIDGYIGLIAAGEVMHPGILSIIDFTLPSSQKR